MKNRFNEELQEAGYIGDGVYCAHDGFQVWLGLDSECATIALDPETLENLLLYVKSKMGRSSNETDEK